LPASRRPSLCWGADPDLKTPDVTHGLAWAPDGADPVTVWNDVSLRVDPAAAAALMSFFMDASSVVAATGYNKPRQQVRRMSFYSPAVIELSEAGLDPDSWRDMVDGLRAQLLTAPRTHFILGHISPHNWANRGAGSRHPYIHDVHIMRRHPELYAEWIADPCGIQISSPTLTSPKPTTCPTGPLPNSTPTTGSSKPQTSPPGTPHRSTHSTTTVQP